MPLGDELFYTVTGEEVTRAKLVQIMIDYFNNESSNEDITDFNEGSQIRNLLESLAVLAWHIENNDQNILRACFLSLSYGRYLDLFGVEYNTPRKMGTNSHGTVTFSIPEPVDYTIEIPYGTLLRSSVTGLNYLTNLDTVIPIGATSADCPVYSQVAGVNTNAEKGTITIFGDTKVYNQLSVNNSEALTGGSNLETDDEYRARLLEVKNRDSFGSIDHYTALGNDIAGVHDVYLTESATKTGKVIVNSLVKPVPDSVYASVVSAYTDEHNLVYRQSFEVEKVSYTTVNLEVTVYVTDTIPESEFNLLLDALFNQGEYEGMPYNGLFINEALSKFTIMTAIESIPRVMQITDMTSDGETFLKLEPDTNTVLKLGTVEITQEIGE